MPAYIQHKQQIRSEKEPKKQQTAMESPCGKALAGPPTSSPLSRPVESGDCKKIMNKKGVTREVKSGMDMRMG